MTEFISSKQFGTLHLPGRFSISTTQLDVRAIWILHEELPKFFIKWWSRFQSIEVAHQEIDAVLIAMPRWMKQCVLLIYQPIGCFQFATCQKLLRDTVNDWFTRRLSTGKHNLNSSRRAVVCDMLDVMVHAGYWYIYNWINPPGNWNCELLEYHI